MQVFHLCGTHDGVLTEELHFLFEPEVPSFYTKDYVGAGISISS